MRTSPGRVMVLSPFIFDVAVGKDLGHTDFVR